MAGEGGTTGGPPIAADAYDHTGNVFLDVLVGWGWLDVGGDRNITYFFDDTSAYHLWTAFEKATWRAAMQEWANVANITSQELSSPAGADLYETWVNSAFINTAHGVGFGNFPYSGYHYLPHEGTGGGVPNGEYNSSYLGSLITQATLAPGGYGYWLFVHEIGHGLGLIHPHGKVDLENEPSFPGVVVPNDLGDFEYNQQVYTLMSYNRVRYASAANDYGEAATPMALDIAAIQFLYGPNTTFHSGADTYLLPDENVPGTEWRCIWDTGGIDTLGYNGKQNATIDLRPATLIFGDPIAGGAISQIKGIFGGYTIANGVVVENAVGGSGNDMLVGNFADNILNGGAGDDTAVFSGNRASCTLQNLGDRFVVLGPDGTDTLVSIEHAQFADTALDLNAAASAVWLLNGTRDLTADGTSDAVWYKASSGSIDLWKIGNGHWAGSVDVGPHPSGWLPVGTGDLNGDGTNDLLWYNPSTGGVDLWKIVNGQWAGSVDVGPHRLGYRVAGIGDFNHDGTADVLWYNSSTGAAEIWKIVNGHWSATLDLGSHAPGWAPIGAGDFNHDGTADIVWYNPASRDIDIWLIVNGQRSASVDVGAHPLGWVPAGIGDFNHDGTSDIAWYNSTSGDIDIWQILNGHWNGSVDVGSHPLGWTPVGVGDFNHDLTSDIAWYNSATGNVDIWQIVNAHWAASVNVGAHPLG